MRFMKFAGITVVLAAMLAWAAPAAAQTQVANETTLLNGVARTPQDLSNYLGLAQLYFQQGRYDEAERILANAQSMVRRQRMLSANFSAPTPRSTPQTITPAPRSAIDAASAGAVRVGGDISEPKKIKDVKPAYPEIAQNAMVQGIVILEILVDQEGRVAEAKVLRSIPLLDQAAIDAVTQWQYMPTLLNGAPVPVVMTVTVNFSLGR
jgi:protein TonB